MREAVRSSYRETLRKIPEAAVTRRKQTACVYIVQTGRVEPSSPCERQISVFELEINSTCLKKVQIFRYYFAKLKENLTIYYWSGQKSVTFSIQWIY